MMSKQAQKKEHLCVPFWLFGVVHLNIKKNTQVFFLSFLHKIAVTLLSGSTQLILNIFPKQIYSIL